ncbi:MAG TPA: DNA-formamidopyrimidine glycosylase family protein [Planctomycetota bacterium]|nr:DNA-formamidopyrimidine glycosylase family protein [Planctomycetota bacterium]
MPELPEVEVFRRLAERGALKRPVVAVRATAATRILDEMSLKSLRGALIGKAFTGTDRHGKHLLLRIARDGVLGMHFGLTGELVAGAGEPPAKARLSVLLTGDHHLAVIDPRQFGRVSLAQDAQAYRAAHALGPDALAVERGEFTTALGRRRGALKAALMDQSLIAGVGNVYADEILFQSGLHPQRSVASLDERERIVLHRNLHTVLARAIEHDADPAALPQGWLLPARKAGGDCPRCATRLASGSVGGRTTYWCPGCQASR